MITDPANDVCLVLLQLAQLGLGIGGEVDDAGLGGGGARLTGGSAGSFRAARGTNGVSDGGFRTRSSSRSGGILRGGCRETSSGWYSSILDRRRRGVLNDVRGCCFGGFCRSVCSSSGILPPLPALPQPLIPVPPPLRALPPLIARVVLRLQPLERAPAETREEELERRRRAPVGGVGVP